MERLSMRLIQDIIYRLRSGQSDRAIARDLGHSRVTIRRYRQLAEEKGFLNPVAILPDAAALLVALGEPVSPPCVPSTVEPYRSLVVEWLAKGVEMTAIHQRLVQRHGYTGSYSAVRRFVRQVRPSQSRVIVRIETPPGHQAQVDFGSVGAMRDPRTGKPRPAYCFVMTLSYSRHQYLEFVFEQSIPTWIGCHRRAFESFGGVPHELVLDNLKAAVLQAALEDTILSAPYRQMAQHYGLLLHPCRVRTPQHKGKVENGVHYVKRNFLAGHSFYDIDEANDRGRLWVKEQAGTRDHGTTHQPPLARFAAEEAPALLPLPKEPFSLLEVRQVKLHPDCHVIVEGSYYSAPAAYVGRVLEAHIYEQTIQLFDGLDLLVTHPRAKERGQRLTRLEHYPQEKAIYLQRTPEWCREKAEQIGPSCQQIACTLLEARPLDDLRAVQSLMGLLESVGAERLEAACARALHFGDARYRRVKSILAAGVEKEPLTTTPLVPSRIYLHARSPQEFFPEGPAMKETGQERDHGEADDHEAGDGHATPHVASAASHAAAGALPEPGMGSPVRSMHEHGASRPADAREVSAC